MLKLAIVLCILYLPTEYPDNWAEQDGDFLLDLLDQHSSEFLAIESLFHQTLTRQIVRIERIQNWPLWCKYSDCSRRMMKTNEGKLGQKMLFHGTRTTNAEKIYKGSASFDMTFSQQGMHVGKGQLFCCECFLLGFLCTQRVILRTNAFGLCVDRIFLHFSS